MVKKKKEWEIKKEPQPVSISLRKKFVLSIDDEFREIKKKYISEGWTELFKVFLLERSGMKKIDEFEDVIINFILEKAELTNKSIVEEFRKWFMEKMGRIPELKERSKEYLDNKQYKRSSEEKRDEERIKKSVLKLR